MRGKEKRQGDFLSHAVYDSLIPPDHFLRRLSALLDWEALATELRDCYRHCGRHNVPLEELLRILSANICVMYPRVRCKPSFALT